MMKKNNRFIENVFLYITTLSLLLLNACSEEKVYRDEKFPINVTASAKNDVTRSGADIQTNNFRQNQRINAYYQITGGDAIGKTPTILTVGVIDGGKNKLTPDVQPYYPSTGNVDIYALYPKFDDKEVTKNSTKFTVESNQEDEVDYMKSDLMWAGIDNQVRIADDVNLEFAHKMAKIALDIKGEEDVLIKQIRLVNTLRTIGMTARTGELATAPDAEADVTKNTILVAQADAEHEDGMEQLSGTVLFPPQHIQQNFIEVTTNFGITFFSVDKTFESGVQYSASLTVTRQAINSVISITDWTAQGGSIAVPPGSSVGLSIVPIPDQQYDGSAKTPPLTITYTPNDKNNMETGLSSTTYTLVKDKDYTADYFNNTNIGVATVIITGKKSPERTGAQEVVAGLIAQIKAMTSFNITPAEGQIYYPSTTKEVEYKYNETVDHELNKNGGDGRFTYETSDKKVATVSVSGVVTIKEVGSTTITAKMDNSGNYTASEASYDLTIKARSLNKWKKAREITTSMATTHFPYTGQEYRPAVVVKDNGRTLLENTHYSYSVTDNRGAGKATIILRGKGNYSKEDVDTIHQHFFIDQQEAKITLEDNDVILAKGFKYTRKGTTNFGQVKYKVEEGKDAYLEVDANTGEITAKAVTSSPVKIIVYVEADGTSDSGWTKDEKFYNVSVVESSWEYTTSGTPHLWECPLTGNYQLEAYGAMGAGTGSFQGGRGADVGGRVNIEKGDKLWIYVGGTGSYVTTINGTQGGWNGGGIYAGSNTSGNANTTNYCGGGGATDFATEDAQGKAWNSEEHLYSRILVAGGGGGALYYVPSAKYGGSGGNGGAYTGETGYGGSNPGSGGGLNGGGAVATGVSNGLVGTFGTGGNYNGTYSAGCGGGGWYGGASGGTTTDASNTQGAGGGGSSFIYNTNNAGYYPTSPSGMSKPDINKWNITGTILVEGGSTTPRATIKYMGPKEE